MLKRFASELVQPGYAPETVRAIGHRNVYLATKRSGALRAILQSCPFDFEYVACAYPKGTD
jgi:hypothetical protein